MRKRFELAAAGLILMIGGAAMADDANLGSTAIGMDVNLSAATLELRVNDVPVFDPAEGLAVEGQAITQLPLNPAFQQGHNTVSVRLRFGGGAEGFDPAFKADFGVWSLENQPMPFDGRPMAVRMAVTPAEAGGAGAPVLTSRVDDQPQVRATAPMAVAPPAGAAGSGTGSAGAGAGEAAATGTPPAAEARYDFNLDVALPLPPAAWMGGQALTDDRATADAVTAELKALHDALGQGFGPAMTRLAPFNARQAAAIGATPGQFAEASFGMLFDGSGYRLAPFDVSKSELRIYGDGRLATMVPIPLVFDNDETDEHATLFVYFWKDRTGAWQIIH